MEFIFQISGHPKVGKKTMPGLLVLLFKPKSRYFRKGFQKGAARIRQILYPSVVNSKADFGIFTFSAYLLGFLLL
jgi:hypothetical protein